MVFYSKLATSLTFCLVTYPIVIPLKSIDSSQILSHMSWVPWYYCTHHFDDQISESPQKDRPGYDISLS